MFTLSILATVLQGRFEVAPYGDNYREPLPIWTTCCYASGGRKTAVFNAGVSPILHWEKLAGDRARDEINRRFAAREVALKRIEKLKQDAAREDDVDKRGKIQDEIKRERQEMPEEMEAPRCFTGNATPERTEGMLVEQNGKLSILSDEGDTLLNFSGALRGGIASLDVNLKGHSGSALRSDRQGRKAHLDRPTLSVGLIVQTGTFAELAAGKRLRSTGLLARFLYGIPRSNVGSRNVRIHTPIPPDIANSYHDEVMALMEGYEVRGNAPRILPFTPEALELWLCFAEEIEKHQGEGGKYETISDWTSKLPGHAARLAALFQIAEHGLAVTDVGADAAERALELCRLLIPHAEAAFSMLGADDADADSQAVLRWIKARELKQFTRREAQRAMHSRFSKVERLEGALASLRDNYILSGEKKEKTGGRASSFYLVNPKLFSMKAAA
jgi:putative DNA primase/helicase